MEDKLRQVIDQVIAEKGYDVPSYETMPDHVHMLVRTTRADLARVMNMVKGISSRRILQAYPELRLDMHSNHLWASGYYAHAIAEGDMAAVVHYIGQQKRRAGLV